MTQVSGPDCLAQVLHGRRGQLNPVFAMNAGSSLRVAIAVFASLVVSACGPRQVEVRTAPAQSSQLAVQVNNSLSQAVNVYVTQGGTDTFLRQVAGNSTATIPVQGFAPGSTVALKAVTVDGVHTYSRSNVTLNGTYVFPLP